MADSTSIPHIFRPDASTSFGHLISAGTWKPSSSVSPTATAAASVNTVDWAARIAGRTITDRYRPSPGGEDQLRPRRPRPAVCSPANTQVPSGAPDAAISFAASLVEATLSNRKMVEPSVFIRSCRGRLVNRALQVQRFD